MTPNPDEPMRVPALWPYLLLCALVAVWIDLGTFHEAHHSDSIVPVLTSLYRWTPFFWGCNRFGMLIPLVATPIHHPLVNLLVEQGLSIFSGLAMMFLLARYVLRDPTWPVVAALGAAAFLALPPSHYRYLCLATCEPYGVSLSLGLGGLLLLADRPQRSIRYGGQVLGAFILIVLAQWVNAGTALVLGPLVVGRAVVFRPDLPNEPSTEAPFRQRLRTRMAGLLSAETAWALGFLLVGLGASLIVMRRGTYS